MTQSPGMQRTVKRGSVRGLTGRLPMRTLSPSAQREAHLAVNASQSLDGVCIERYISSSALLLDILASSSCMAAS